MKKLYIILAAAAAALSANAQFHFLIDGKEVASGSRVDITSTLNYDIFKPDFEIKSDVNGPVEGTVSFTKGECDPALDATWTEGAEIGLSWCGFSSQCVPIPLGETLSKSSSLVAGVPVEMEIEFMLNLGDNQEPEELGVNAECTVKCKFGGKDYDLTLFIDKSAAGVNDVMMDSNAPVEYFDLQGRRVANPSQGLYIIRQGSKVTKSIVK